METIMGIQLDCKGFSLKEIAEITSGYLKGNPDTVITSVSTDSRDTSGNELFIAIRGERLDAHKFLKTAFENGAVAAIVDHIEEELPEGASLIIVDDTTEAFGKLAAAYRDGIDPLCVAVTGSVGKTTTRQFIYSVLHEQYKTHRSEKNYNNEIGTPISLLSMKSDCEAAVFELGMSSRGEISYLTKLVRPDIAVITNIGTSHIENLGSREAIRDAKMEITEGLKENGDLILNADEPLLSGIENAYYVGINNEKADFRVLNIRAADGKTTFDISYPGGICKDIYAPALGAHIAFDSAYAFAVGYLLGIPEEKIKKGIADYEAVEMRQNIVCHDGITFIHDYYNASPESMKAALSVLLEYARLSDGRAVAVLGDMRELGEHSRALHEEVGKTAAELGTGLLFTFGEEASAIADGAEKAGMSAGAIYRYTDLENVFAFGNAVNAAIRPGDAVLLKASRAVALERVIQYLTGHKENL